MFGSKCSAAWTLHILTWFLGEGFLTVMCNYVVHPQKCAQDEVMSQASHHSTDSTLLGRRQSTLVAWLSVRMTNALPFYHGRCAADQTGNTSSVGLAGRWLIDVSFSTNHSAKVKQNLCSRD